ncbi:hypothetical protein [Lacrimispora sp.]|uniref:hypothetical protein n=1 Tax=Lacrimispora sp. TaxID=2719234 RepID=UPI0039938CEA
MIDWSATAAWVTLALTLVISIVSPVISTYLSNKFQLKIREYEKSEKEVEQHYLEKREILQGFISNTGKLLNRRDSDSLKDCGEHFYLVYTYLPKEHWNKIDLLHQHIQNVDYASAQTLLLEVSKVIAELLEESDRTNQLIKSI